MDHIQTTRVQRRKYIWGRGQDELDRLIETGRVLGDLAEHMLCLAGVERGTRVLDVGCGAGDVLFVWRSAAARAVSCAGCGRRPEHFSDHSVDASWKVPSVQRCGRAGSRGRPRCTRGCLLLLPAGRHPLRLDHVWRRLQAPV